MKPTTTFLLQRFDYFNNLIFRGLLPPISIHLTKARSFMAKCVFKRVSNINGGHNASDFQIRFNTRVDLPQNIIEDILIHEMIHYYIGYNQIKDSSSHGQRFRQIMNNINSEFGRNISITHTPTPEQNIQLIDSRPKWHVIAIVKLHNGLTGLKVIPRVIPTIIRFYNAFSNNPDTSSITLYLSNSPFFNQFPNSGALKVHIINPDQVIPHLKGAHNLRCDGSKIHQL